MDVHAHLNSAKAKRFQSLLLGRLCLLFLYQSFRLCGFPIGVLSLDVRQGTLWYKTYGARRKSAKATYEADITSVIFGGQNLM